MEKRQRETYRVRLMLELSQDARLGLETWLRGELDRTAISVCSGLDLGVVLATSASRRLETFEPLIDAMAALKPDATSVALGPALASLPNRHRPRVFLLPARCFGFNGGLGALIDRVAGATGAAWGTVRQSHIVAGRVRVRGEVSERSPVRTPGPLPRALRGPFDAVRLGLYCSTIKSEGRDFSPLARVELPEMAAVR